MAKTFYKTLIPGLCNFDWTRSWHLPIYIKFFVWNCCCPKCNSYVSHYFYPV